jgi:hypothetical protein
MHFLVKQPLWWPALSQYRARPFTFTYSEDPNSDFYKMERQVYDISKVLTPETNRNGFLLA